MEFIFGLLIYLCIGTLLFVVAIESNKKRSELFRFTYNIDPQILWLQFMTFVIFWPILLFLDPFGRK